MSSEVEGTTWVGEKRREIESSWGEHGWVQGRRAGAAVGVCAGDGCVGLWPGEGNGNPLFEVHGLNNNDMEGAKDVKMRRI